MSDFSFATLLLLLLLIFVATLLWQYHNNIQTKDYFENESVIPLTVYMTWHSKQLPPKMAESVKTLKRQNPQFSFSISDTEECRSFLNENFSNNVLFAYDTVIPPAFKSDIWRLCVLYINGGIYMDMKFEAIDGFTLSQWVDSEHYIKDWEDENAIFNGILVCKAGNPFLLECIKKTIENVENREYGEHSHFISGPKLLGSIYYARRQEFDLVEPDMQVYSVNSVTILFHDKPVLKEYAGYRDEQKLYGENYNYRQMWTEKRIYVD